MFHWLYRFFYSKTVGLILILLLAAYAVVGSVVVQTERATFADPVAKESFLTQVSASYGAFTGVMSALGLFHAFTSVGFYVVVTMLALSVIACTAHRIPELIRRQRNPRLHVSDRFFDKARYRGRLVSDADPLQATQVVRRVLKENRFRVIDDPRDPSRSIYADRFAWSGIGTVLAHLSFIVILAAFVISSTWGIDDLKIVPVGGTVEVGHGTDLKLTANSFTDSYTEDGRPADYVTDLSLFDPTTEVARQEVRVNSPLAYGPLRYHQQSFGIAAELSVLSASGEILFNGAIPLQWTSSDGRNAVGRAEIPEEDLELIVATAASGQTGSAIPPGAAAVELYRLSSQEPVQTAELSQGEELTVADLVITFERETKYTGILVRKDPGAPWMWVGSLLLVIGMCVTFMFQYRRIWVRVRPARELARSGAAPSEDDEDPFTTSRMEIRFGAVSRLDASYQRLFENVIAEVSEELSAAPGLVADVDSTETQEEEE